MKMTDFTMATTVDAPFDATVERVRGLLGDAGFGVLTEIDLAATLRAKIGAEIPQQVILGACRPPLAYAVLQADPRMATMLPCNVVVAEVPDQGTRVEVFDPALMDSFSDSPAMAAVSAEARDRLGGMITTLQEA